MSLLSRRPRTGTLLLIVVFLLAVMVPLMTRDPYILRILIQLLIACILAFSLFPGLRTGSMNMGLGGFMAVGGYTAGLLAVRLNMNSWLALPLAGILGVLVAIPVGVFTLKMKGMVFGIFTMALTLIISEVIINWQSLTGGPAGVSVPGPNAIHLGFTTIEIGSRVSYYYYGLALAAICLLIAYRMTASHLGRLGRAIGQNEEVSKSLGVDTLKYKLAAFIFGGFFAAIAGAFSAQFQGVISPGQFGIWQGFMALIYVQVGGMGSLAGAALGAGALSAIPELFRPLQIWYPVLTGGLLVLCIRFFPMGLVSIPGVVSRSLKRLVARGAKKPSGGAPEHGTPPVAMEN